MVRLGDEAAFEEVYDRHHRGILSFCRHMLGSREEGEDAVQHVFIAAYRDLQRSNKPIHLKAWLYTIARNRCLSMLRARREQVSLEDIEPATDGLAAEVQVRQDLRDMLVDLRRLPDDQRAALVLSELGALSHEEIAMTLDVRKDKVKALVFQARESLATARQARNMDCREVQEQLSVLRGGSLRRATLRRHVEGCPGCQGFREEVRRQRAAMAIILPVAPTVSLKGTALASALTAGGAGGAALGGATAGGAAGGLGSKLVATVAVLGAAAGGGFVATEDKDGTTPARAAPMERPDEGEAKAVVATLRERARKAGAQRKADLRVSRAAAARPAGKAKRSKARAKARAKASPARDGARARNSPRSAFGRKDGAKGDGATGFVGASNGGSPPARKPQRKEEKVKAVTERTGARGRGPDRPTPSGLRPPRHSRPARPTVPARNAAPPAAPSVPAVDDVVEKVHGVGRAKKDAAEHPPGLAGPPGLDR